MKPIRVYCAGAMKRTLTALVEARQAQDPAHAPIEPTFGPAGRLKNELLGGAAAELVILSRSALDELDQAGCIEHDSIVEVAVTHVAVLVRRGQPLPDVSSREALRNTLLQADSITYGDPAHGDSSGTHFSTVLDRLGIRAQMADRIRLAALGLEVIEKVASGEAALGATQSLLISADDRIALAGPLPGDLGRKTTYAAALTPSAGDPARALLAAIRQG